MPAAVPTTTSKTSRTTAADTRARNARPIRAHTFAAPTNHGSLVVTEEHPVERHRRHDEEQVVTTEPTSTAR